MVGTFTDFAGRTALSQLRSQPQFKRGDYTGALLDTARGKGASTSSGGFFTVQSGMRSEASVFRALGDGLGKARGAIAAAETGTRALSSVLDRVDRVIGAVEAGAPGSSFKSALDGLQQQAEIAIARGGYAGTNLLKEGEALTVTLGFKGNSTTDFRQLSIEAVGLSPTDAARQTTTVTQTVTETVETPVTRGELLTERVERLENRINNITSRETRIQERIERLTQRQDRLTSRLERLDRVETRLNDRLEASGARPTDPKDIKKLDQAKDFKSKADRLEAEGKSGAAAAARKNADKFAVDAGLTISLDKLERLETRLTRTQDRQVKVAERLSNTTERIEVLGERLVTLQERKEVLTERLETTIERLDHLSSEKLNEVVRTRTETVEREVQTEVAQETNVGFDDLVGLVQKKLADGDTEGAKAVVAEARARIERVQGQLGQIDSALGRRSGFLGDVSDRIQKSIRVNVDENLDDTSAARRAAQILSELAKNARLFSGDNAEPGILELFKGIGSNSGESDDGGSAGVVTEVEFEEVAVGASVENSRTGSSSSGDIQPFRSGPTLGGGFRL